MLTGSGDGTAHLIALPPGLFFDGQSAPSSNAYQVALGDLGGAPLSEGTHTPWSSPITLISPFTHLENK